MNHSIDYESLNKHKKLSKMAIYCLFISFAALPFLFFVADSNENSLSVFEAFGILFFVGPIISAFAFGFLASKAKEIFNFSIFNIAVKEYFHTTDIAKLENRDLLNSFLPPDFQFLDEWQTAEESSYNSPYKLQIDENFVRIFTEQETEKEINNRTIYRNFEHHWVFVRDSLGYKIFYEYYDINKRTPKLLKKYEVNEKLKKI